MPSSTYFATGGWQVFTVPTGVTSLSVTLNGAGASGRRGGRMTGKLAVKGGQKLYLVVPKAGGSNSGAAGGLGGWGAGGHGGNGYNASGGDGGGGYAAIRYGSTSGSILCVAGGAGGNSGDGGLGGVGGSATGASGGRGSAGSNATGASTGGTQSQGGNGGTSSSGSSFNGHDASNTVLAAAGAGGTTGGLNGPGGGGGGGGWHGGGGGCAGSAGYAPGVGGAGGSNYEGRLTSASGTQGTGNTGNGSIILVWDSPAPSNQRPNTPHIVSPTAGYHTKSTSVTVKATVSDVNKDPVRMVVQYTRDKTFKTYATKLGSYVSINTKTNVYPQTSVTLTGLYSNYLYYVRVYAEDSHGLGSTGYSSTNFYTNLAPLAPTLFSPLEGATLTGLGSTVFTWTAHDPDLTAQNAFQIQWKREGVEEAWSTHTLTTSATTYTANPGTFKANTFYVWQVRTQDSGGLWGPWSDIRRFFVTGTTSPPRSLDPHNNEAIDTTVDNTFTWKFVDPDPGDSQYKADIRWRVVGTDDGSWVTKFGTHTAPGAVASWTIPADSLLPYLNYEWQVRTYDTLSGGLTPSDWSNSATFRTVYAPGSLSVTPTSDAITVNRSQLGCGVNRVLIYDRGGKTYIGELTGLTNLSWGRNRDDISQATGTLKINTQSDEKLLASLRTMRHEVVIWRDDQRVWEGPLTRLAFTPGQLDFDAKDVMQYVFRRVMRQGYDDSWPNNRTVVDRAARIIINALSIDDPNVLPYLTRVDFFDDAKQSRIRADYSSTAWEEVDDMAQKAGLDYVVAGRRIILFDTSRSIGRLGVMRDQDFSSPLVVTEYGANLCTDFAVTNNNGAFGLYHAPQNIRDYYGVVEMLASAYGDTAAGPADTMTSRAKEALTGTLVDQAKRNISDRYPAPLVVRVPDSATISPETAVDIQNLIPGVWIPLQATGTVRKVTQWQKLDSMTVTQDSSGEKVAVIMSPAPQFGQDPDAADTTTSEAV